MAVENVAMKVDQSSDIRPKSNNVRRAVGYFVKKILALFVMVFVSVLLIIVISNYGGYIDKMVAGEIDYRLGVMMRGAFPDLPQEEREARIEQIREQMYTDAGRRRHSSAIKRQQRASLCARQ